MAMLSPLLTQATPVTAVRGEGMYLFDAEDRRFLDFTAGIGVASTGHCHPKVVEAIQRQAGELIHGQYTTVMHPRLTELCERLGDVLPGHLDRLFFASAGTEAVEGALRLVRQATARPTVIVFQGSFHGRTMGSLSMTTSKNALRAGLQPLMGGVAVAPFPAAFRYGCSEVQAVDFALAELDELLATQVSPAETAAMFIEPIVGEGGFMPAPNAFLQGLRERCDRHGILLVVDEIQSGYGRSGDFWAHADSGVRPDVLITAKGLASGMPLSAFAAPEELMRQGWPGSQGGTYGGNAVASAAALATLDVIEQEGLVDNAREVGTYLRGRLAALAEIYPSIGDVRGRGFMVGTELVDKVGQPDGGLCARVREEAARRQLLMLPCGAHGQVVRWLPPLIATREHVDAAIDTFGEALDKALATG